MKPKTIGPVLLAVFAVFFLTRVASAAEDPASNSQAQQSQNVYQQQNMYYIDPAASSDPSSDPSSGDPSDRMFPYATAPSYPGVANYWATVTADGRFQPLVDILQFQDDWTVKQAEELADQKGGKVECRLPIDYVNNYPPTKSLLFLLTKPENAKQMAQFERHYRFIKPATFLGENRVITSKVFGTAVVYGLKCGANMVLLLRQGFGLRLDAESVAIGLNPQLSVVNSSTGTGIGGVAGGGFGWVHAWAEYYTKPWLKVAYFRRIGTSSYKPSPVTPKTKGPGDGSIYHPNVASPPAMQTGAGAQ